MSDFLANLAARSKESELEIVPRPPARFEPEAVPDDLPPLEREAIASNRPQVVEPRNPDVLPVAWSVTPDLAVVDPPRHITMPAAPPVNQDLQPVTREPRVPQTVATPTRTEPAVENDPAPRTLQALDDRDGQRNMPDERNRRHGDVYAKADRTEPGHLSPAPRADLEPGTREERVVSTATTVSRQGGFGLGDATPVVSRLRPAFLPETGERVRQPAETSPPTIQVSIGRIEVRAVAAPPRETRREKATSSVLPLNDYLRLRKEGS